MNRLPCAILFVTIFVGILVLHAAAPSADDLRKADQNPMVDLLSVPFQNNTNFGYGVFVEDLRSFADPSDENDVNQMLTVGIAYCRADSNQHGQQCNTLVRSGNEHR